MRQTTWTDLCFRIKALCRGALPAGSNDFTSLPVLAAILVFPFSLTAQAGAGEELTPKGFSTPWAFVKTDSNRIHFAENLDSFFARLRNLGSDSVRQVRIVHIGDSHLQADVFSGKLRTLFQQKFGSAGRGLIFPYRMAGTNGPRDYTCSSNVYWQSLKSIYAGDGPSLGLCGLGLRSSNAAPALYLQLKQKEGTDYAFDKVTIFCKDASGAWNIGLPEGGVLPTKSTQYTTGAKRYHKVRSGDTLYDLARKYGCTVRNLQRWNGIRGSRINPGRKLIVGVTRKAIPEPAVVKSPLRPLESVQQEGGAHHVVFQLDSLLHAAAIEHRGNTLLHGILLENTRESGVLYNMIGVNGATYNHYNQAAYFLPQLAALAPDLVIVSLGTNESVGGRFDGGAIRRDVERLVRNIRKELPGTAILLTTNPDVLKRRRYLNANNLAVRSILLGVAEANNLAAWDLHTVMGGHGSVKKWRTAGLAANDAIHFTPDGYQLLGNLLFDALMKTYDVAGN
ncbi:MAG: LysM peptidoglycan-binding domain-containing protein [Saprospiraceae bacterium]|nr:LysM peptidoglycan-binding domain-containing protein [Saprospiraceae bacterium]